MKDWTFLMWVYLILAIAGIIFPWYYNIEYMMNHEETLTPARFIKGGLVNSISSSITWDLIVGSSAASIFIIIEALRLKMKHLWFYILATYLIAFAFVLPFFLFMRERKLNAQKQ